jgi:protein O-GlcNAc transferase
MWPMQIVVNIPQVLDRAIGFHQLRQFAEAERLYGQILQVEPKNFKARHLLGVARYQQGQNAEALALIGDALKINPGDPQALANYGLVLHALRRFPEALAIYDKALASDPNNADTLCNLGNLLQDMKRATAALASYDKALAVKPDHFNSLNNRGNTLVVLMRLDEALASLDKALAINPDQVQLLNNRGAALIELKRYTEALINYERALAIDPNHLYALGGMADVALNLCDWQRTETLGRQIRTCIAENKTIIPPVTLLGYCSDALLQLQCARSNVQSRISLLPRPLWDGTAYRHGKIRIAYLSSDFGLHPVAFQLAELIECHDRTRFEVLGISTGPGGGSEIRDRLAKAFDSFHDVNAESDLAVAGLLRRLEVDILIDLNGHTRGSRFEILSYRPCPVQVNYLGFPGTMGADFIDYVIADKIVVPFDQQSFFTEKIVHLPDSYWVSDAKRTIGATPTRKQAGLPEQGFVFCCFNNNWKITAPVFEVWMRLLGSVPGSVLWLKEGSDSLRNNLRREATVRGIDAQRLIFAGRVELGEHLARHRLADLFLDTLLYNAHATASDALWAGLPVVTCRGKAFAGRVAASLLYAVGLPELVTDSLDEYEALVLKLARDPVLLHSLRGKLEQNRLTYPLFNTDRFRRNIEAAYTRMWEITQQGEEPRSFSIELQKG